jgi:hypothetical protein
MGRYQHSAGEVDIAILLNQTEVGSKVPVWAASEFYSMVVGEGKRESRFALHCSESDTMAT